MTKPLKLDLSIADLDRLHEEVGKTHQTSKQIRVSRALVVGLLLDHGRVIAKLDEERIPYASD